MINQLCNFPRLLSLSIKNVSSAKSILFMEFDFGKSFIIIKKKMGLTLSLEGPQKQLNLKMI